LSNLSELEIQDSVDEKPNADVIRLTLIDGSYQEKSEVLEVFTEAYKGDITLSILNNIVNAELFYSEEDKKLYRIVKNQDSYLISEIKHDFTFGEDSEIDSKSDFEKVRINNRLRSQLRQLIAAIQLSDPNPLVRKEATKDILKKLDTDALALIQKFRDKESDEEVSELMDIALAIGYLKTEDEDHLEESIATLSKAIEHAALNSLKNFPENTENAKRQKSDKSTGKKREASARYR